jgi:hypothetical protein
MPADAWTERTPVLAGIRLSTFELVIAVALEGNADGGSAHSAHPLGLRVERHARSSNQDRILMSEVTIQRIRPDDDPHWRRWIGHETFTTDSASSPWRHPWATPDTSAATGGTR